MGAHILAIKDMAGLLRPYAAEVLVKRAARTKSASRFTSTRTTPAALNAASILKAADAGVDVADAAIASMSGQTSQPNLNSIVAALQHTPRDTGLDLDALESSAPITGKPCAPSTRPSTQARRAAPPRSICTKCPAASSPISRSRRNRWASARTLAGDRPHVSRRESGVRRHRQGHAVQQSRRRSGAVPDQP